MAEDFLKLVRSLPCVVCGKFPVEAHHPRGSKYETGIGLKAEDRFAIPLCPKHHRTGGHSFAVHAGQQAFEQRYGTHAKLMKKRDALLNAQALWSA